MKPCLSPNPDLNVRRARPLLGTFVDITACGSDETLVHAGIQQAFAAVEQVHRLMSYHDAQSDVSRLNRKAALHPVRVHAWTYAVLEEAIYLSEKSRGVFDVSVAPVLECWGFLPRSFKRKFDVWQAVQYRQIHLLPNQHVQFSSPDVRIDLGGIAKGFAVDAAVEALQRNGIRSGLVNAGGDLRAFGNVFFRVTIRDPENPGNGLIDLQIKNGALANSGHYFARRCHEGQGVAPIADPKRQASCMSIPAVGVLASTCMRADAMTKICMILGRRAEPLVKNLARSAYFIRSGHIDWCGTPPIGTSIF